MDLNADCQLGGWLKERKSILLRLYLQHTHAFLDSFPVFCTSWNLRGIFLMLFHFFHVLERVSIAVWFGFHPRSLSGPKGAAGSLRGLLARSQRHFVLPDQQRPSAPLLSILARTLSGCWLIDSLPLARTHSTELSLWLMYHLFGTLISWVFYLGVICFVSHLNSSQRLTMYF